MLYEKIRQLHENEFYRSMSDGDAAMLGFIPHLGQMGGVKGLILSGRWSALHFSAILGETTTSHAVRILPHLADYEWPVYAYYPSGKFTAPCMKLYLLGRHIERLIVDRKLCVKYYENWDRLSGLLLPVLELLGSGKTDLEEIKSIVFDKNNWPKRGKNSEAIGLSKYRSFCLEKDKSHGNLFLWNLLDQLVKDEDFVPEPATGDLGVYEPRIKYHIAIRARDKQSLRRGEFYGQQISEGLMMPHGSDLETGDIKYYPKVSGGEFFDLKTLAEAFWSEDWNGKRKKELAIIPECIAVKAIGEDYAASLNGMTLLEAAAILDGELNEPVRAWNCLVSAGFWAGESSNDTIDRVKKQDVILRAAIYLCEKHQWHQAVEVLKHNHDILMSI